jgi:hypothetical protein
MDSTELLDTFRGEVSDAVAPYLWSDVECYRFMDSAQKMFCRLTDGIEDSLSKVTQLSIVAGTDWYKLSPLVLKLRTAVRADNGRRMTVIEAENLERAGIRFDMVPGVPRTLVSGLGQNMLRVHPMPSEDAALALTVFRLPLLPIDDAGQEFEINEMHHEALLLWMKHRAYSKHDAETFDKGRAKDYEDAFQAYCAAAKREQNRRRHPAGVVQYGGM